MGDIEWYIFDIGGVLVPEISQNVYALVADVLRLPPSQLQACIAHYHALLTTGHMSLREMYATILHEFRLRDSVDAVLEVHLSQYRRAEKRLDQDIITVIDQLRERHSVACLTNTEVEIAEISRQIGVFEYFDKAFLSTELGLMKPHDAIYRKVLHELQCRPENVVLIDDNSDNIDGARHVNIPVIHFTTPGALTQSITALSGVAMF